MDEPNRIGDDTPIPDEVAERILAKAADLDERQDLGRVTVAQLRAAALEAGISQQAFDEALQRVRGSDVGTTARRVSWMSRVRASIRWSGAVGGFIGVSWGALMHFFPLGGEGLFLLPWLAGIGASLHLALRYRRGSRLTDFALSELFLWLYMFAAVVATGVPMGAVGDMLALIGPTAVGCLMAGAAIVRAPSPPDDSHEPASR
jgi:hypothetical protein